MKSVYGQLRRVLLSVLFAVALAVSASAAFREACSQSREFSKRKKLKIRNYQILKIQFTTDFSLLFG